MVLIARLIDEVPTIKVIYENKESIPAPSEINDCQILYNNDYNSTSYSSSCTKYLNHKLLVGENVRKRFEQYFAIDPNGCSGLIHNGSISLREGDLIVLNLTLDSAIVNALLLFDSEYLTYSDPPQSIDILNLENLYIVSHYSNSTMFFFNRFERQLMDPTLLTQIGFSPNYKTYHYISFTYQSFSNHTYTIMKFKPKTTILQVEIEQKFVVFGGSPEKPFIERFKDPLETSLIERIEYLESQIKGVNSEDVKSNDIKSKDIKFKDFNAYFYF
ncbi:45332_t:CDS:2 [Gigaspora margarita]|uniref:45332_t:CDS:1 n=1 Tax=Gigaspora margarita TaxID=4874 RepID=A0ABN7VHU0_GIGMA|nr:45332_t:CDS:2 [Gigaspora margarita]